jgi:hypothetical protein
VWCGVATTIEKQKNKTLAEKQHTRQAITVANEQIEVLESTAEDIRSPYKKLEQPGRLLSER